MEISKSLYIIKPDAYQHRNAIRVILENAGLNIIKSLEVQLPEFLAREFYSRVTDKHLLRCAVISITEGPVEIGIVSAVDAVETLLEICGRNTIPSECKPSTIRYKYGLGIAASDGITIIRNAIHRCKTNIQAKKEVEWFYSHLPIICEHIL